MAAKKKPAPVAKKKPRASGPSQPEGERTNKLFAIRLTPEMRATLEAKGAEWGIGLGPTIIRLVEAGLAEG